MRLLSRKFLVLVIGLFVLIVISVFVMSRISHRNTLPSSVNDSLTGPFTEHGFTQQWPLTIIDDKSEAYLVRVLVEPQIILGQAPYGDFIALAWNKGYITDKTGNVVSVAVPRVWYKPDFHQLYLLGTADLTDAMGLPGPLFLQKSLDRIDALHAGNESIVGVYVNASDDSILNLKQFFTTPTNQNWILPPSFIANGSVKDLPLAPNMGVFLPATNLSFDIRN